MVPLSEWIDQAWQGLTVTPAETVPLVDALGRISAETVTAGAGRPLVAVSRWDGFALRAADVTGTEQALRISGELTAGQPLEPVSPGAVLRIATGAALPAGLDAVVPLERVLEEDGAVRLCQPVSPGDGVRPAGSELPPGTTVLDPGRRLEAGDLSLLAAADRGSVRVRTRPKILILPTGDEIRQAGRSSDPRQEPGTIGPFLEARARRLGGKPRLLEPVPDRLEELLAAVGPDRAEPELIVSIGGTGRGGRDLIRPLLEELGARLLADGLPLRPGGSTILARWGPRILLALPGGPGGALAAFETVAAPLLTRWLGQPPMQSFRARPLKLPGSYEGTLRAVLVQLRCPGDTWIAEAVPGPAQIALAQADGLALLPPGSQPEEPVAIRLLRSLG